jgi:hypothetical protein
VPVNALRPYAKSIGEARLMIGNVIHMMCRSPKSRAGCHFGAAIGLRAELERHVPVIPRTSRTISTPSPGGSWGAVSIISEMRERSWCLSPRRMPDEVYRLWALK